MSWLLHSAVVPDFQRRHAEMVLDVFAKERWVRETCLGTYLLDAQIGMLQIVAYILKHVFCYPFVGSFARILFAYCCQIFGRYAQVVGVGLYRAVLHLG